MSDSCPLGTPRGGSRSKSKAVCLLVVGLVTGSVAIHMLSLGASRIPVAESSTSLPVASPKPGTPDSFAASAQESIARREYEATETDRGLQAPNRAHNLRTYFEPWGIRVEDRTAEGSPELFRMKTVAISREGRTAALECGEIRTEGVRVESRRGDGIVEWYVNGEHGLEHGYDLDRRPAGDGALQIDVSFEGARVSIAAGSAVIETASGRLLGYSKLVVQDINGGEVPSLIESVDAQTIRLTVSDNDATYPIVVDPLLTSVPDATLQSDQADSRLGVSVSGAGDVNGDGYADAIVGASEFDAGEVDEGTAYVFHGGPTGITSGTPSTANAAIQSDQGGARLGSCVSGAGDVNGDGYDDVIVGAANYDGGQTDEGAAFVFHGGSSGVTSGTAMTANATLRSDQASALLGSSVSCAGDVNGDGYADVIVGAHYYFAGQASEGAAFVFHGGPAGISSGAVVTANAVLQSDQPGAWLGYSVAGAGDVDGDGYSDVIIGAPYFDEGQNDEGAAFVFEGGPSGIASGNPATANAIVQSDQESSALGWSVARAGDVNGDGIGDIVLGAPLYDAGDLDEGVAFVFHGSLSGIVDASPSTANATLQSNQTGARLGNCVAGLRDVNGDGYADVVVGANAYDAGQEDEGAAFIFLGSTSGIPSATSSLASTTLQSDQTFANLGCAVAGVGDINGDGYSDVLVGADAFDSGQSDEGEALFFHGGSSGIASGNPSTANGSFQTNQPGALLSSIAGAGDVNGDGYSDVIIGSQSYDGGTVNSGAVWVFHGGPAGIVGGTPASASATLLCSQSAGLGLSVAGAGDVNGDGYADVIASAPFYHRGQLNEGAAFIFHGGASGITSGNIELANATVQSDQVGALLGSSVAGAGDVNGDGYADVIVGAQNYDDGHTDEGAAFVFHGGPSGISDGNPLTANATLQTDQANAAGSIVSDAGDVNGDGYADVIFGAISYDPGGAVFVFQGGPTGIISGNPTTANATLYSEQVGAQFGNGIDGAGDVNGDGYADVVASAILYHAGQFDEGAAFVFHGGPMGIESSNELNADAMLQSNQASTYMGASGVGDVNGDGFADIMAGAYAYDAGETNEGAAFVFHGSPTGISSGNPATANATLQLDQANAGVNGISGVGDINGDGYGDVCIVAYAYDAGQTDEGAAFIYHGNGNGSGRPVRARQLRGNGDPRNVEPWGSSHAEDFRVRLSASHPEGRGRVKLQVEACPAGESWGGANCVTVTSGSWVDVNATSLGVTLTESVSGLSLTTLYRWRARVLHAPFVAVSNSANPPHGPWRRLRGQAFEADIRNVDCLVSCPSDVVVGNDPSACGAVVNYPAPSMTGSCGTVTCLPASGTFFQVGTTTVNCVAANGPECTFTVTVNDTEAPMVTCPMPVVVANASGQCSAVVSFNVPSPADNCSGATVTCVPASGSTFPVGVTTVTCTAVDAASNTGTCGFSVTVEDTEAPAAICPMPIIVGSTPGLCSQLVNFAATSSDNCPGASTSCTPPSGSTFPVGTTMVTCITTDASANTGGCSFSVTVNDTQAPALSCPANIQTTALSSAGRVVSYTVPTATDNCGATVVCLPAPGSTFSIGTTTVTCTATDAASNSTNCEFTVQVAPIGTDTAGIYVPATGSWFLRNANSPGAADLVFGYGPAGLGWIALRGDWDGNGSDTAGLYDPANGNFFLKNTNAAGGADLVYGFGPAGFGWQPLVGDWDGDGVDTIGLYDSSTGFFFLRNSHAPGAADLVYGFGPAGLGWTPMLGDWDGNGTDTVGLYDPATGNFFLRNTHAAGGADLVYGFGPAGIGWKPLAGDWNGDGADTIGLYSPTNGFFFLRNFHAPGAADVVFGYGPANTTPILGDWNGL